METDIKLSTFQPKDLIIPYSALEDLLRFFSTKLVGKTLKRIEITPNSDILKIQIKELIYESTRDLQDLIIALNYGLVVTSFEFKQKESKEK